MVNKFLVVVVLAIVTQSFVLQSSAIFEGFSEEGYATFDLLESEDYEARAQVVNGLNAFLDMLRHGTGQASSYPDLSPLAEALSTAVESTNITYYAALIVARGNCDEFDAALNESLAQLKGAIEIVISSVALAHGGNYDENRSEIEHNRNFTEARLVSAYQTLFEFLYCCISDSSEEFDYLLQEVEENVNGDFHAMNNALYAAIEANSILTSECTEEEANAAFLSFEENRLIATVAGVDIIENMFALYEATYIVTYLNGSDIAHGLFTNRLGRKRTSDKLEEAMKVVFVAITRRLLGHTSYHEIESNNSTLIDPSQAVAVRFLQSANYHFLETILITLPNSAENVTVAKIMLPQVLLVLISHYYQGMDLAEAGSLPYRLSLLVIASIRELQTLVTNYVVEKYFEIIGSDAETEARLGRIRDRVMASLKEGIDAAFDAIEVLSEVAHANEGASEDDWNKVQSYLLTGIAAVRNAAKLQLGAGLYEYIHESGY